MGVAPARQLVDELRTDVKVEGTRDPESVRSLLRRLLLEQVGADMDRTLHTARHGDRPAVVLVVGVNGTGKTTTVGKLARVLIGTGRPCCSARPTRSAPQPLTSCRPGGIG